MRAIGTATACAAAVAQGVDGLLVEDRHVDVGELGQDQQRQRDDDADAQRLFALWPQMPGKNAQNRPGAR